MKKLVIILGCFGTSLSAIFVRFADAPSGTLVIYRMLFSCLALFIPVIKRVDEYKKLNFRDIAFSCLSGIFLGIHFFCYFESLKYTSIAASVSLVDTEVFFVVIFGSIFLNEKVSKRGWVFIGITFLGSVIVTLRDFASGSIRGDMLAILGAVCSCFYTLIGRKNREKMSTVAYTFIVYFFAGLVVTVLSLGNGIKYYVLDINNILIALGMTVCCTLLGHSIYSWGLKYEKASYISVVKLLEPVFSTSIGFLVLGEKPLGLCVVGCIIILYGITMLVASEPTNMDE